MKTGPGCADQGRLMHHIGPSVCPIIYRFWPDGYEMEMCRTPVEFDDSIFRDTVEVLAHKVWNRSPFYDSCGWHANMKIWLRKEANWLYNYFLEMYPVEPTMGYCLTH